MLHGIKQMCTNQIKKKEHYLKYNNIFIYLKGCGTALKEAPPAAARETFPIVATKLETTALCGKVPVPPITRPPEIS